MLQALPRSFQVLQGHVQTEGMAFGDERVIIIRGFDPDVRGITSHEITHLAVAEVTGRAHTRLPSWLDEGLAEYGNINPSGEYEAALRHVSSLYQAFCEGLVLFVVLWLYSAKVSAGPHPPAGAVSGLFLIGYGALRIATEFFREPDAHIGFISMNWLTMGQLLSIVMVAFGIFLMFRKNLAT